MNPAAARKLLDRLFGCIQTAEVRQILNEVGDSDASTLDVPFGPHNLVWKAFGDTTSNLSSVGLGSKSGRSLTERITNAIDAILEERAPADVSQLASPRQAANRWYGRPISGPDSGLYSWKDVPSGFDRHIHVIMRSSDSEGAPTIDVMDDGIGIDSTRFHDTILSLQAGNKIRKRYLIGAFGQGGASTLAFCQYALVFSRSKDRPDAVAFTVIRVLRLDSSYKDDCYAYLALKVPESSPPRVLESIVGKSPITVFEDAPQARLPDLVRGTIVRHVGYRLSNLDKGLQASPGNLYHYLHFTMFDPLIPFRIVDLRPKTFKNEYVGGARNRLMAKVTKSAQLTEDEDDSNVQIRHYRAMEYIVPSGSVDACIGLEYWVVFGYRKKGNDYELRSYSNELFIQQGHPIVGTMNGQNQGEITAHLLKQINLNLVSRHIIVHVDATNADSQIRRELFATNREGFKEGPVLDSVMSLVKRILEEDDYLRDIEKELTERIAKRESEATKGEVKREVAKLLKESGFSVGEEGQVDIPGKGSSRAVEGGRDGRPRNRDPLPTLPYPSVTRFAIVYPVDIFQLPLNDTQAVVVETDADAAYDRFVQIRSEPPLLEIATRAPLRGGRIRWRLRPVQGSLAGQSGEVIATLTKPDGTQLTSKVLFELLPAREKESRKARGQVPPFDIKPIAPENSETWNVLWPDDRDDPTLQRAHAYKALQAGGAITVYYSTVFAPYRELIDRLKTTLPARCTAFDTNYAVWVGYHAILQSQQSPAESSGVNDETLEQIQELERQTVARV